MIKSEKVLVLPKQSLPEVVDKLNECSLEEFEKLVREQGFFKLRSEVEEDETLKQVIPYLVFQFQDKYFVMQRKDSSEDRLKNKFTLGIGGHVNESDLVGKDLMEWARREFDEEVDYKGEFTTEHLGLINDDSIPVNRVHIGCVILLKGDSDQIKIKDEHKSGELKTLDELKELYEGMESWSQFVFNYLTLAK